jgi:hypothetical protein
MYHSVDITSRHPDRMLRQLAASVLVGLVIVYVVVLFALAQPPTLAERHGLAERPTLAEPPTLVESPTAFGRRHACPSVTTGDPGQPSRVRPTPRHTPRVDPLSGQVVSEPAASLAVAGNVCTRA